ncbi:Transcriptional activator FLO8 [Cyberlindnera fabianii]|uniref:Transcriptional activator FLO8 n=1 Tax=Cyberlindnera fabianii TaxID=36022 RepID=A0A1V2L5E6_CYBFA|nr:Transcriptional activator FLO8 [Cyberlindnera fabianii]
MNNQPSGPNKGGLGGSNLTGNGQDNRYVNDLKSTNSKQLLNAYVYDFLIKSSLSRTAQSFIKEADIPTGASTAKAVKRPPQKDLLPLAISLDAPQGFLYEWWQIFWDVFNARTHRGSGAPPLSAPTPQSQGAPQQQPITANGAGVGTPVSAIPNGTPVSAGPNSTPMALNQQLPIQQQQIPGQFGQFQQPMGGTSPNKKQRRDDMSNKNSPLSGSPITGRDGDNPSPMTVSVKNGGSTANMPSPLVQQTDKDNISSSNGSGALHDYQMQLLLLERENKKMLNTSKKDSTPTESKKEKQKKMPPPKNTKTAGTPTGASPGVSGSQVGTATGRKKSVVSRRKGKKATAAGNNSEPPTPTTPLTPNPPTTLGASSSASTATSKKNATNNSQTNKTIKEENGTPSNASQLTPPNSENAINNGDIMLTDSNDLNANTGVFAADVTLGGHAMNGAQPMGGDLYPDFALSDFSNEISGDGNFNLETFLNTDGADMGFDSYWRDSVEATE